MFSRCYGGIWLRPTDTDDSDAALVADDEGSSAELAKQRREADDRAKQYLDAGERVTHRMAWSVLSLWTCKRHTRRKLVRPDGETHIRSDILGVTRNHLFSGPGARSIGKDCKSYPHMVRFFNKYFELLLSGIEP